VFVYQGHRIKVIESRSRWQEQKASNHIPPPHGVSERQCDCNCSDGKSIAVFQRSLRAGGMCRLELSGVADLWGSTHLRWPTYGVQPWVADDDLLSFHGNNTVVIGNWFTVYMPV